MREAGRAVRQRLDRWLHRCERMLGGVAPGSMQGKTAMLASVLPWVGLLVLMVVPLPRAHAEVMQETINFDIPAQSLTAALIEFSRQADVQVMGSSAAYTHLRSKEVKGRFTASEALRRLLRDTGLKYSVYKRAVVISAIVSVRDRISQVVDPGNAPDVSILGETISVGRAPANFVVPLSTVTVIGTHIRGGDPIGVQLIVLDRSDIAKTGYATVQDLVRSLPQNFGGGPSEDTNLGTEGNTARSSALNLRGLGAGATLVLINGRRMAPGGSQSSFIDVSSIPLSAVSRVEVLTDGASAVYGADAVGGVVNFVMRDDYGGAETRAAYRTVTEGSLGETTASQLFGRRWETGHATLSYSYFQRDSLRSRDRDQTRDSDLTRFGGSNFSSDRANPGNLLVGNQYYAVPRNQNGVGLSPASLIAGTRNLQNLNEGRDVTAGQILNSGFASFAQELGLVTLSSDMLISRRHASALQTAVMTTLLVPASNPFRVFPVGVAPTPRQSVYYSFDGVFRPRAVLVDVDTLSAVMSAKIKLPRRWQAILSATYGAENTEQVQTANINTAALNAALADPNPLTAFNPYADGSGTNQATLDGIQRSTFFGSHSRVNGVNLLLDGGLFALPGGEVRLATGMDYRSQVFSTQQQSADVVARSNSPRYARHVAATFAEMQVPLVAARNHVPGIELLQLSLAARHDDFSDFGAKTTPRIGLEWSPVRSVSAHGSWGRSFKAPDLPTLNEQSNQTFITPVPNPLAPSRSSIVLAWLGGNPDLRAESAETWSAGLRWAPELPLSPSLDVTYYDVHFQDRIRASAEGDRFLLDPARYGSLTYGNPPLALREQACGRSRYLGNASTVAGDCLTAPVEALIDLRYNNISASTTRGLDLLAKLDWNSRWGTFGFAANANYVLDFDETPAPTAASVQLVDTVSNPLRFRMLDQLTWGRGAVTGTLAMFYSGSYRDNLSSPQRRVGSSTTFNMNVRYEFENTSSWLDGTSIALDIQNLFDRDPPFVNNPAGVGYDRENADLWNRMVSLQLKKDW